MADAAERTWRIGTRCTAYVTLATVAVAMVLLIMGAPVAVAQAPDGAKADAEIAEDIAADEPLDPGAGADGTKEGGTDQAAKDAAEKTMLQWAFESLGWTYSLIFLSLSFTLVALIVMNLMTARRETILPVELVQGFENQLNEKKYQEAYELARSDESFLGQVLAAGISKLSTGYPQAIEAMQEVGEEENMKLEHRLSYMALIGTISPMIGLFGTVQGMIAAFQVIATSRGYTPEAWELAQGISTALFTTLVGLFIAIPAIAAYNLLRNRVARLVLEVGIVSEGLMARFQNVGTKKP